jgi:hypothetical protein
MKEGRVRRLGTLSITLHTVTSLSDRTARHGFTAAAPRAISWVTTHDGSNCTEFDHVTCATL